MLLRLLHACVRQKLSIVRRKCRMQVRAADFPDYHEVHVHSRTWFELRFRGLMLVRDVRDLLLHPDFLTKCITD